jgi:outer membrane protein OmpA-like peptidoglycan-associated protein
MARFSLRAAAMLSSGLRSSAVLVGALSLVLGASPFGAPFAQDIQRFQPAPGVNGGLAAHGSTTPGHLNFVPGVWFDFGRDPLVERDDGGAVRRRIVGTLLSVHAQAALGLFDRGELGVEVPVHFARGDALVGRGGDVETLGDIRLIPKIRLLGPPKPREDGFGLAFVVPASVPTGSSEDFLGEGQVTVGPRLAGHLRVGLFGATADLGYVWRPETRRFQTLDVGSALAYAGGLAIDLGTPEVVLLGEVFGQAPAAGSPSDSRSKPLEALGGLRWFSDVGLVATLAGGRGIIADYGSPDWRIVTGLAYAPKPKPRRDTDGDGMPDAVDGCPSVAEDRDGYEDEDGCPDEDNDRDGVPDERDRCPNKRETNPRAADADGCPDPEKPADTDGDGVRDDLDQCPTVREDNDDFADEDGCPETDNDQDGFTDLEDRCPFQAEVINGVDDTDGCPDQGPTLVKVTNEKIEILEKVFFEKNRDAIKPESFDVLDQVAAVMNARRTISRVRIEGHTDAEGPDAKNLSLSRRRAEAVRAYLLRKGVDAGRLEAEGFGETVPIDTNDSPAGRANNRRVEFRILKTGTELIE